MSLLSCVCVRDHWLSCLRPSVITTPCVLDYITRISNIQPKITKKFRWIHNMYSPGWVQEELSRRGSPSLVELDGEFSAGKMVRAHGDVEDKEMSFINNGHNMIEDSVGPIALITLLKACVKQKGLDRGIEIHTAIVRRGLLENVFVGSTLISMYTKCGALAKAQEVFDKLPVRSVVSWTALISGYVQHGYAEEALGCFERMQLEGLSPNAATFTCILKACGSIGASDKGEEIHGQIVTAGLLAKENFIGTALVDMYAKCGLLGKAQGVFDELSVRNAVLWNALIAGYAKLGHGEEALDCFDHMQCDGFLPEAVTFSCILKACSSLELANRGRQIHAQIFAAGSLVKDTIVGTALVDMYAKCGLLVKAQAVFDEIPVRNVVLWTALTAGYALHGYCEEAFNCFEQMYCEGISPDTALFDCILKACGSIGALDKGHEIHAKIVRDGLLQKEEVVSSLVNMYAKCGKFQKAQGLFDELSQPNIVTWNVLISGYTQHGHSENALYCFECMQHHGFTPDAVTFACILQACGSIGASEKGQEIHAQIVTTGLLEEDVVIGSALIDMYAKCGLLGKAQEVFDELPLQNVVCLTALIAGYAQHGHNEEALKCFEQMQMAGLSPDAVTFACILRACCSLGSLNKGEEVYARIVKDGLLKEDVVHSALIAMFTNFGLLAKAQEVLEENSTRTLVSWTLLIAAYIEHGQSEKALICFHWMQREGFSPDAVTFACILKACGSLGAFDQGQEIHAMIARYLLLEKEIVVANALIDMYSKCGLLQRAQEVFDKLLTRDIITWNVLIAGQAQLEMSTTVFNLFDRMLEEGEMPDIITFTILLNTCSHRGLLDTGQLLIETMSSCFGVVPNLEHHACMIDLFGRAGHLDKAVALIEQMPFSTNHTVWSTMLGACQKWGDTKVGIWAFQHALQLDEKHAAAYICMSNIYAAAFGQEDAG